MPTIPPNTPTNIGIKLDAQPISGGNHIVSFYSDDLTINYGEKQTFDASNWNQNQSISVTSNTIGAKNLNYVITGNYTDEIKEGIVDVNVGSTGTNIYLGGSFSYTKFQNRNGLSSVSSDSSAILSTWDPKCNGEINCMILNGADMYIGGQFSTMNSVSRNNVAAVSSDVNSAITLRTWNPNCNGRVRCMILDGSNMYLGGDFSSVNSVSRGKGAAVSSDVNSAITVRTWNPNCNFGIWCMVLNGGDMYIGGGFSTVNGNSRSYAAAVSSDVNSAITVRTWNPNADNNVNCMILNGADMYLGGSFLNVKSTQRKGAAAVSSDTSTVSTLRAWNPGCIGAVNSMILNGSDIYLGGDFNGVNNSASAQYGKCVALNSDVNVAFEMRNWRAFHDDDADMFSASFLVSTINCMKLVGNVIYIGGFITNIGEYESSETLLRTGMYRGNAMAISSDPSLIPDVKNALGWDPACNGSVNCIVA